MIRNYAGLWHKEHYIHSVAICGHLFFPTDKSNDMIDEHKKLTIFSDYI
jgi:hypothetical protein